MQVLLWFLQNRLWNILFSSTFKKAKNGQMSKLFYFWQTVSKRPNGNPDLVPLFISFYFIFNFYIFGKKKLEKLLTEWHQHQGELNVNNFKIKDDNFFIIKLRGAQNLRSYSRYIIMLKYYYKNSDEYICLKIPRPAKYIT